MTIHITEESKLMLGAMALFALWSYGNRHNTYTPLERFSIFEDSANDANRLLAQSSGILDHHAMNALHVIESKKVSDRTVADHLNAANLRHLYRDEGNVDGTEYSLDAMPHYTRALVKAQEGGQSLRPSELLGVTQSAENYLDKVRAVTPYRQTNRNQLREQQFAVQHATLQQQIDQTKDLAKRQTLQEAKTNSNTKAETVQKYLNESKGWNVDRQNVHDSSVMSTLKETVERLGVLDKGIVAPPDEQDPWQAAYQYMNQHPEKFSEEKRRNANFALQTMHGSHSIHAGMEYPENRIFEMVWQRSHAPVNQEGEAAENIKDMIIHNLADCTVDLGNNNKSTVCASGRIGRMLSSLTMTDAEETLGGGGAMTVDAIRNETFEFAQNAVKKKLDLYRASDNEQQVALVQSYENPTNNSSSRVNAQVEDQFKQDVMQEVKTHIEQNYEQKLTLPTKETLLQHVEAGI